MLIRDFEDRTDMRQKRFIYNDMMDCEDSNHLEQGFDKFSEEIAEEWCSLRQNLHNHNNTEEMIMNGHSEK